MNRPPPRVESKPVAVPIAVTLPDGRIAWPHVFHYQWANGVTSPCPPRLSVPEECDPDPRWSPHPRAMKDEGGYYIFNGKRLDGPGVPKLHPWGERVKCGCGYRYIVHDLAAYDALCAMGALNDPRHTGIVRGEVIDMRAATQ